MSLAQVVYNMSTDNEFASQWDHDPETALDALKLIEGYRAGGTYDPIVVLGIQSEQELAADSFEVGADGYVCVNTTTTRRKTTITCTGTERAATRRSGTRK